MMKHATLAFDRVCPRIVQLSTIAGSWLFATAVWACPFCDEALAGPGAKGLSRAIGAYKLSMYALIAVPVLLVGGIAVSVIRSIQRVSRSGQGQQPAASVDTTHHA